ncbi:MAG: lysophospholipase [Hyphomonadaceae bacterium]|nr:lysophospholipase [Hyphomonadaceae bacterium]
MTQKEKSPQERDRPYKDLFHRRALLTSLAAASLSACAPTVLKANDLGSIASFQGPRFEGDKFYSFDGAPLGLSAWLPPAGEPWAVIVGLHGMNDYAETYYMAGPYWAERGVATYAYDARGHGRSPDRGKWGGDYLLTEDLRTACAVARRLHPRATLAVVGESMGAATAAIAFGGANPPDADRLVLVAPAVWGWSDLPNLYAAVLWMSAHTFPWRNVTPPRGLKIVVSDNTEMLRRISRDRNMIFETRIDALYGLVRLMQEANEACARLNLPTAFLYGAKDQVIPRPAAERAAARLPRRDRTLLYPNGYHMLLRDLQAPVVFEDILAFLRDPAAAFPSEAPPLRQVQAIR